MRLVARRAADRPAEATRYISKRFEGTSLGGRALILGDDLQADPYTSGWMTPKRPAPRLTTIRLLSQTREPYGAGYGLTLWGRRERCARPQRDSCNSPRRLRGCRSCADRRHARTARRRTARTADLG